MLLHTILHLLHLLLCVVLMSAYVFCVFMFPVDTLLETPRVAGNAGNGTALTICALGRTVPGRPAKPSRTFSESAAHEFFTFVLVLARGRNSARGRSLSVGRPLRVNPSASGAF